MLQEKHKQALMERIHSIAISGTLRMEVKQVDHGYCEIAIPRQREHDGIFDSLHGGILMTLADSVAAYAVLTMIDPNEPITTTDMNIRFLAPCFSGAIAKARVIKLGRTMCPVSIDVFDEQGKQVAVAQVNYLRLQPKPQNQKPNA